MSTETLPAARKAKMPAGMTPAVSDMLDFMVEEGLTYQLAAAAVGITVRSARRALDKPAVLSELRRRKKAFCESIAAANPIRLAQLRDQDENRGAAVAAAKALELIADESQAPGRPGQQMTPGFVIIIGAAQPQGQPTDKLIDVSALADVAE